jgi:hypothetical protein
MKKITLSLMTLLVAFQLTAQSTEKTYFLMNESRVVDTDIYKKNYPAIRNWWMAATKGITYNFAAHTSESGRTYSMVFVKGDENLGKYVGLRSSLSDKVSSELKASLQRIARIVLRPFSVLFGCSQRIFRSWFQILKWRTMIFGR